MTKIPKLTFVNQTYFTTFYCKVTVFRYRCWQVLPHQSLLRSHWLAKPARKKLAKSEFSEFTLREKCNLLLFNKRTWQSQKIDKPFYYLCTEGTWVNNDRKIILRSALNSLTDIFSASKMCLHPRHYDTESNDIQHNNNQMRLSA